MLPPQARTSQPAAVSDVGCSGGSFCRQAVNCCRRCGSSTVSAALLHASESVMLRNQLCSGSAVRERGTQSSTMAIHRHPLHILPHKILQKRESGTHDPAAPRLPAQQPSGRPGSAEEQPHPALTHRHGFISEHREQRAPHHHVCHRLSVLQHKGAELCPEAAPAPRRIPHKRTGTAPSPRPGTPCLSRPSSSRCGPALLPAPPPPPRPSCRAPGGRTGPPERRAAGRRGVTAGSHSGHRPARRPAPTCSSVASHSSHCAVRSVGCSPRRRKKYLRDRGTETGSGGARGAGGRKDGQTAPHSLTDGVGGEEHRAALQPQGGGPRGAQRGRRRLCGTGSSSGEGDRGGRAAQGRPRPPAPQRGPAEGLTSGLGPAELYRSGGASSGRHHLQRRRAAGRHPQLHGHEMMKPEAHSWGGTRVLAR